MFEKHFTTLLNACAFAEAIVETVREPMVVLDAELRVVAASRAFYRRFMVSPEDTEGKLLFELGDGQWDIPKLRTLLEQIIPDQGVMDDYEVAHEFPGIGQRTMLLNARQVFYETDKRTHILLGIEDVTGRRILEREKDELLQQKDVLLDEMQHRVANSLQIIASIIMLKAKTVESEEVRRHLHDAHKRVISVAAVQRHLHASIATGSPDAVEVKPYLTTLCEALAGSMIGEGRGISLIVRGEGGSVHRRDAESIGLITTELVINSLKHAFTEEQQGRPDHRRLRRVRHRLETFGRRQWCWQAGRRVCSGEIRARHRHRHRAGEATRRQARYGERAGRDDRVGDARNLCQQPSARRA